MTKRNHPPAEATTRKPRNGAVYSDLRKEEHVKTNIRRLPKPSEFSYGLERERFNHAIRAHCEQLAWERAKRIAALWGFSVQSKTCERLYENFMAEVSAEDYEFCWKHARHDWRENTPTCFERYSQRNKKWYKSAKITHGLQKS
jgi:hypothetical protein